MEEFTVAATVWTSGVAVVRGLQYLPAASSKACFVTATESLHRWYMYASYWEEETLQVLVDADVMRSLTQHLSGECACLGSSAKSSLTKWRPTRGTR